jgi:hypothetical protein
MISLLAQSYSSSPSGGSSSALTIILLIELAIAIVVIAGLWKVFVKAGWPGWYAIIPILNAYAMIKIAGKPGWWLILFFIPLVNIVIGIMVTVALANVFGKGIGFALGLIFLGFIFIPILGFGSAVYQEPGAPVRRGFPVTMPTRD